MSSRLSNSLKTNGLKNTLLLVAQRALERTGGSLIKIADHLPLKPKLTSEDQTLLDKNAVFHNAHKGRRAFVIGTGPSIQTQDLSPLSSEITISLSGFWKHPVIEQWQPTYYCFTDPMLFDGSETMREFFRSLVQRLSTSVFFVPLDARDVIENDELLPLNRTNFVAFSGDLSKQEPQDIDLTGSVPGVMNVAAFCILLAIYMGCSPIYLLGLDHDWLAHQGENRHFYAGQGGLEKHPDLKPMLRDWGYKFLMQCALSGWDAYENLLKLANKRNIRIFNATNGGFLDVFERVQYEEILANRESITEATSKEALSLHG